MLTPANLLVTGPPRCGKTTVVQRVSDDLESRGYRVGGVYCPELRSNGERVGFEIVDVMSGASRILAHVDRAEGPKVGKYRVSVEGIDAICATAFDSAFASAEFLVVDEVAPMECYSETFVRQVRRALDSDLPVVAAVQYAATAEFIGEVKARDDTQLFEVTDETRDELPRGLVARLLGAEGTS